MGGFFRYMKKNLWLPLLVAAILLILFPVFERRPADLAEVVARRAEKTVEKRMNILEKAMNEALAQRQNDMLDLDKLPLDMVVYRYIGDTLQSWCHQFSTYNDDISRRFYIQRLGSGRSDADVSPLCDADSSVKYVNMGPKWYLVTALELGTVKVIGGLEIINSSEASSMNGVNPKLRISQRFRVYPIEYTGGAVISYHGKPLVKVIQENAMVSPLFPGAFALWAILCLLTIGILAFVYTHRTNRRTILAEVVISLICLLVYIAGYGSQTTSDIFSPTIFAYGTIFFSLGALLIINLWILLMVVCLYIGNRPVIRWAWRSKLRMGAYGAILAAAFLSVLVYIILSFRCVILNSNITLELYEVSSASRYTVYVYISYLSLAVALLMILKLLTSPLRYFTGKKVNVFSRSWRFYFSTITAACLVAESSYLGFVRESDRVEIWANRLSVDRDLGFELDLRNLESAIAVDPLIPKLIDDGTDYRIIMNRLNENYLSSLSQDYDISLYMYSDGEADRDVLALFNERLRGGTPIGDGSRFMYSRTASGRAQYTGIFLYYSGVKGVTRLLLGIEPKADKEGGWYATYVNSTNPGSVFVPLNYSYCKYYEGKMSSVRGDYSYPTVFSGKLKDICDSVDIRHALVDGYMHFVDRFPGDEVVVISRPKNSVSMYMVAGFTLLLVVYFVITMLGIPYRDKKAFGKNYYKARINMVLQVSLGATLVTLTLISIFFVYNRNERNVSTLMTSKINTIQSLVQNDARYFTSSMDFATQAETGKLDEIGNYTKSEITLFRTNGRVLTSTAPDLYERLLLGSRIDEGAYRNIRYRNKRYYIHKERYSGFRYYAMYAPIFNAEGTMLAIVRSPYSEWGLDFKSEAIVHSMFIITVFLLLLILARFFSARVVDKMFGPLIDMGAKMKEARTNGLEYIIYERDDEISSLVRAYNLMVHDLSVSSREAAQVERDKAWSQMARQVAHEIKNPLTPMKLQIQRIVRLRQKQVPGWEERLDAIIPVILESIDTLTDTANEFSTFAKLYSEEPQLINLDSLAQDEVTLFDDKQNITFHYMGLQDSWVMGPKPQLTRVFVNLLTNAVQAIENQQNDDSEAGMPVRHGEIILSIRNSAKDGFYDIVFEDNGPGVKDENRNKLFVPNFTTKSSGTGLGLAICKNIIDRCGGDISYSRSFTLEGACFTIHFPKTDKRPAE